MENSATILEKTQVAQMAFNAQLEAISADLVEVNNRSGEIQTAGDELICEFSIAPEFFEDKTNTFFFSAIANRYADLEKDKDHIDHGHYGKEKDFIFNAVMLLTRDSSGLYPELKSHIDGTLSDISEEDHFRILESYTNHQVSKELKEAIDNGLIDNVKQKLGITPDNEDPYEVRVLNIGDSLDTIGLSPQQSEDLKDKPNTGPEWQAWLQGKELLDCYFSGLKENIQQFEEARGQKVPIAWITKLKGITQLCLRLPMAEKILYPELTEAHDYYNKYQKAIDVATLEHEYTHTQGGLNQGGDLYYGIGVEERRAELFSGDKMGYQDVKAMYGDLRQVSGTIDVVRLMRGVEKGGQPYDLYATIATDLGLQATLELAMLPPRAYVSEQDRPMQSEVAAYLGGADGVIERIFNQAVAAGKSSEIDARIEATTKTLMEKNSDQDCDNFFHYRSQMLGANFITNKMKAVYERTKLSR